MCKRRLVLSDIACGKCKEHFCVLHRQPELHACPCLQEAIQTEKALLAKQNPRIIGEKLERF